MNSKLKPLDYFIALGQTCLMQSKNYKNDEVINIKGEEYTAQELGGIIATYLTLCEMQEDKIKALKRASEALEIIKKYFELTEDNDEYEIFHYGLHDKQYVSSRSSLCIQPEEFELLKEVFNENK